MIRAIVIVADLCLLGFLGACWHSLSGKDRARRAVLVYASVLLLNLAVIIW